MAGRFEGLSDLEWKLFEDLLPQPPEKRGRGMPHVPFRRRSKVRATKCSLQLEPLYSSSYMDLAKEQSQLRKDKLHK